MEMGSAAEKFELYLFFHYLLELIAAAYIREINVYFLSLLKVYLSFSCIEKVLEDEGNGKKEYSRGNKAEN